MCSHNVQFVVCPVCSRKVDEQKINQHLDNGCSDGPVASSSSRSNLGPITPRPTAGPSQRKSKGTTKVPPDNIAPIFTMSQRRIEPPDSPPLPSLLSSLPTKRGAVDQLDMSQGRQPKRSKAANLEAAAPLAERLRPGSLTEFVGQSHLTGPDSLLMSTLATGSVGSIIFWGPPGCGKTTLARLLAKQTDSMFKELSATGVGINEVRVVFEEAKRILALTGRKTILFLDEVHRFNKSQQDIFLPFVEQGQIQLIGATTENPSFKLTGALLSRCRVFVLERLSDSDIERIISNAIDRVSASTTTQSDVSSHPSSPPLELSTPVSTTVPMSSQSSASTAVDGSSSLYPQLTSQVLSSIVSLSAGDARTAISLLDLVIASPKDTKESRLLSSLRQSVSASYDRTGDSHYDMISALHKSVRGSQGSAALYWLAMMLNGGEDPLYVARRMVVCASEDIGLADNHALPLAMATLQACQVIGMPECRINLAHLVSYLSEAPKSTRAYEGYKRAEEAAKLDLTIPVPMAMRNAATCLMKDLGYGRGYAYNADYLHPVHNDYLPIQFRGDVFLRPAGDMTGKIWDEDALRWWESEVNGGKDWEGRKDNPSESSTG